MEKVFINFTNHSSDKWSEKQLQAAGGKVIDLAFPNVDPEMSSEEIRVLAQEYVAKIMENNPDTVLVQGEMTLCFNVVSMLKQKGVSCVSACSKREVVEKIDNDGNTIKTSMFEFVQFRQY